MTDVILHHYDASMFSEKIRRVLAYKGIPWRAAEQPMMAPKPDLTPLTGGYRRIPVLQIGADVYCDTTLIARRLEVLFPEPPVLPAPLAGVIAVIEDWADHRLFHQVVPPGLVAAIDALPPGFLEDRAAMTPTFAAEAVLAAAPQALEETRHSLDHLEGQLGRSPFLLGDEFTLADAACFHCVQFVAGNPAVESEIASRPALGAWLERIRAFGPGKLEVIRPADALETARRVEPEDTAGESVTNAGYAPGDLVRIVADDYGQETTVGTVARVLANQITVTRADDAVGTVAVHYPRAGYRVSRL